MSQDHDPMRQASYLNQGLANDKTPLGLFLGAGCPLSIVVLEDGNEIPLIPDIMGITKFVCRKMEKPEVRRSAFDTLWSHFTEDGIEDPNIEYILSHVRGLRMVVGNSTVRGLTASKLDMLDEAICDEIVGLMTRSLSSKDTPYHKLAAWIGSVHRSFPVQLFTLNYDLLLEQALEESRVPYFDGFVGSHKTFFDTHAMEEDRLPPRWARLWKLHGSINWRIDNSGSVSRGENIEPGQRRVIHPSHLKYEESRRMPYLAMIDRLHAFLKEPSALLVICGYSFRDEHLNEVIIQGLQGNPTAVAIALLFGSINEYPDAIKLSSTSPNLSLLAEDEAVVGTKQAPWITQANTEVDTSGQVGISWLSVDADDADSPQKAQFQLGEFSCLGDFLEDVIGARQLVTGDTDAK